MYDNLNTEDLDASLDDLNQRLLTDNDPLITEKITYINSLLNDSVRTNVLAQIDKYVQDSRGDRLNPYTENVLKLRRRTTIKDGKVIFKVKLKNGELSSVDSIVLNRDGDKYEKNAAKRNATAVLQFEELVDKAVDETRDRTILLIDKRGAGLSPDVFERLSVQDQRVVNGVLNPSDTILPESRIGDRGAIQLMIDEFRERSDTNLDRALKSAQTPLGDSFKSWTIKM